MCAMWLCMWLCAAREGRQSAARQPCFYTTCGLGMMCMHPWRHDAAWLVRLARTGWHHIDPLTPTHLAERLCSALQRTQETCIQYNTCSHTHTRGRAGAHSGSAAWSVWSSCARWRSALHWHNRAPPSLPGTLRTWMGVPLMMTLTRTGTRRSSATSFIWAFFTLWPSVPQTCART